MGSTVNMARSPARPRGTLLGSTLDGTPGDVTNVTHSVCIHTSVTMYSEPNLTPSRSAGPHCSDYMYSFNSLVQILAAPELHKDLAELRPHAVHALAKCTDLSIKLHRNSLRRQL